jgi:hypothetical protein
MQILSRADLAALVAYRGAVVGNAVNLEPILERGTWDALQAVLALRTAGSPAGPRPGKYLLTGIARCHACDAGMWVGHSTGDRRRYRCRNPLCESPATRDMGHLDAYVIGRVLRRLSDPRLWNRVNQNAQDNGALAVELAALEARRGDAIKTFSGSKTMKAAELDEVLATLNEEIEEVRRRLDARRGANVLDGLRGLERPGWDALSLDRRKAVVRELFDIVVLPARRGPGFDNSSVRVTPRAANTGAGKGAGGLELVAGPAPE